MGLTLQLDREPLGNPGMARGVRMRIVRTDRKIDPAAIKVIEHLKAVEPQRR